MKDSINPFIGINIPRLLLAVMIGFVFVFAFDFLVHNVLLSDMYAQTPELWRSPDEMKMAWMLGNRFLVVLFSALIFTRGYADKGLQGIVHFIFLIGLFMAAFMSAAYAWMPISLSLAIAWVASGLGTGIGLGIVFGLIYKAPSL